MQICVKILTGKRIMLDVSGKHTWGELRTPINNKQVQAYFTPGRGLAGFAGEREINKKGYVEETRDKYAQPLHWGRGPPARN